MHDSDLISGYVDKLARELEFDRSLSVCVRQEVDDHLWEAVAADPRDGPLEAQRRAIVNFGDPHVIATQFAVVSLAKHSRRAGVTAILGIAGVFIAMKMRVAWYAATQWAICDDMKEMSGIVLSIDRYAFWLAFIAGLAGWAYISSCRTPAVFHPVYRRQVRRFFLLCTAAAAALFMSVLSDGVLTAIQLFETDLSVRFLVPILSMAIEIACAGALAWHVRNVTRRVASTAALLRT